MDPMMFVNPPASIGGTVSINKHSLHPPGQVGPRPGEANFLVPSGRICTQDQHRCAEKLGPLLPRPTLLAMSPITRLSSCDGANNEAGFL